MLTVNAASGFGSGGGGRAAMGDLHQTNLVFHFRADTGITEATGVSNWVDQVSGSTEFAQSVVANQPAYDATETVGSLAGAGAMTFDGVNDSLIGASVTEAGQPFHMFFVFKPITYVNGEPILAAKHSWNTTFMYGYSSPDMYISGENAGTDVEFEVGAWCLACCLWNTASSSLARNNDAPAEFAIDGKGGMNQFTILAANAVNPPTATWTNYALAELLIYDLALTEDTTSKLSEVKTYVNGQYGFW